MMRMKMSRQGGTQRSNRHRGRPSVLRQHNSSRGRPSSRRTFSARPIHIVPIVNVVRHPQGTRTGNMVQLCHQRRITWCRMWGSSRRPAGGAGVGLVPWVVPVGHTTCGSKGCQTSPRSGGRCFFISTVYLKVGIHYSRTCRVRSRRSRQGPRRYGDLK